MRKTSGLIAAGAAIALLASVGAVATGDVDICLRSSYACPGKLDGNFGLDVSPRKLPAHEYAPTRWHLFGTIGMPGEGHPPALRQLLLDIDEDVRVNAEGYPACGARRLEGRNSRAAMRSCREAFLGEGKAHVEVASAEGAAPLLLPGRLLVFNAARGGADARLLVHAHIAGTTPAARVTTITLQEKGSGLQTTSKIPPIADGLGSIVDFEFDVGATYSQGSRKVGYFEAKCPDGVFKASMKKILFRNEAQTPGEGASTQLKGSLAVPCTGRR